MELTQPLHKALQERPRATALVCGARRSDFATFVDRVARLASVLQSLGLAPGDRVGMLGLNSDRYVEYLYATWWAGGVINPVNIRWSPREVAYSLDDCDTRILLADGHFGAVAAAQRELSTSLKTLVHFGDGPAPEGMHDAEALMAHTAPMADARRGGADLAAVMYTGGTTGLPKGVMLSHGNLYVSQLCTNMAAARPDESVGLNMAPMFHVGGTGLTLQLMMRLCKQVIIPAFDELAVLQALQAERCSETFMVPTMLKRLIEHPRFAEFDTSSLQLVLYGAAPIDDALLLQALDKLPQARFCQLYGMTELSPVITALPAWCHASDQPAHRRRSAGRPVPIAQVRIVDAEGRPVPNGTVGEIAARGPMVMQGYWNKPGQTAEVLRDGWMHTGDGGRMDDDGFVYVVDRLKDMVVTGGENVYSAEVENAITQLPQVSMCAVVGVPDERWGERVHAVVVLRAGEVLTADDLIAHCRTQIAGYKCPRSVEFVDAIPLSPAGKMLKYKLREAHWAGRERRVG
ncbi:long-chain-fatty-acid--CoA ligase [Pseudorhodoferax sp. Leaf267]|uniref:long-chain-fatty-acid--CoA ligase n=1 Tax=Pseudorhodoferax sp. Leaf267 TaxID=1736316 RepID=UPI0006FFA575|nr:long-chain-fatty-acid--CoA ligase [Pseudorhodoferax sp. Leaf267]KQP13167.1 fatty-acid--CoA ligase [Pseudorhodoferax sp. Leaf267]